MNSIMKYAKITYSYEIVNFTSFSLRFTIKRNGKTTKLFDYHHICLYVYIYVCMWFPNEVLLFLLQNKTSFNSKKKYFEMLNNYFNNNFYSFCVVSLLMNAGGSFLLFDIKSFVGFDGKITLDEIL